MALSAKLSIRAILVLSFIPINIMVEGLLRKTLSNKSGLGLREWLGRC